MPYLCEVPLYSVNINLRQTLSSKIQRSGWLNLLYTVLALVLILGEFKTVYC